MGTGGFPRLAPFASRKLISCPKLILSGDNGDTRARKEIHTLFFFLPLQRRYLSRARVSPLSPHPSAHRFWLCTPNCTMRSN